MGEIATVPEITRPLAIIGLAAKYSQEATDAEKFWKFLLEARQSWTSIPKDRLNLDGYFHPDPERAGTIHAKGAHFLREDPNAFDAAFFNVNKTEIMSLDPQQRLVMENVYHALENAGIPMDKVVSSNTSVFVSGFNHDHRDRLNTDPDISFKHRPTGSEGSMISGRVSWFYDLKGASLTVDTACSSSMVAFHLATQSLKAGESDMAIVSGVNVFGGLNHILGMSYSGFLGPEGKCFTFDHRANGYSRGEGVGTVIVKPLDKALADGNTIRAVVRATVLNHDGRTPGLTYPSGDAQVRLIRSAYESAGLDPAETHYVESHGTGTPAGDPIEVQSIAKAFDSTQREEPLYIGALKTNIGHIEGGSGISGIIKAVLVLEAGLIPRNVNFERVNPQIHSDDWNGAPERSAKEIASYLQRRQESSPNASPGDINDLAYTLSEKRSRFRWNSYILADSIDELVTQIEGGTGLSQPINSQKLPRIGFVFTGQGAQYPRMGQQLLQFPVFRKSIEAASEYMMHLGYAFSLLDEILKDRAESGIDIAEISHPACTAIQIAMVDLLQSWNISPVGVTGHSSGEIAAAYCAGKISREAAWNIAYHRGRLTSNPSRKTKGAMLAVSLDIETLQPLVDAAHRNMSGDLVIACFNSPKNNTVSGDEEMIAALQQMLGANGVFARRLRTPNAYHSPHMNDIADEYLEAMGKAPAGHRISSAEPVRMFSTSTGEEVTQKSLENEFWVNNLVSTVKFTTALEIMCSGGDSCAPDVVIEIGPHGALQSAVKETLSGQAGVPYRMTLNRNDDTIKTLLDTVGYLATRGTRVNLLEVNCSSEAERNPEFLVDLPPYPFNHAENGLYESRLSRAIRFRQFPRHDLLGAPSPDSNFLRWSWKHYLRVSENPWLKDHVIADNIVFPGAGYLVMAIEATRQVMSGPLVGFRIRDVNLKAMLIVPDNKEGIETCFSLVPVEESNVSTSATWNRFSVSSYDFDHDEWTENCTGYIAADTSAAPNPVTGGREEAMRQEEWSEAQVQWNACQRPMNFSRVCDNLDSVGIRFGPLFRNVSDVKTGGNKVGVMAGTITIPDVAAAMPKGYMHPHLIHPATLDAALQAGVAAICDYKGTGVLKRGNVPNFIKEMWISANVPGRGSFECYGKASLLAHDTYIFDAHVWDVDSKAGLLSLSGVRLAPFQAKVGETEEKQLFHSIEWGLDANFVSDSSFSPAKIPSNYSTEKEWFDELQLAAILLASDALSDLSLQLLRIPLPDHYQRFYDLLNKSVADVASDSIPGVRSEEWQKYSADPGLKGGLYERVANRDDNGAVLIRMGSSIASFLRQEADPLYLMFGQDDLMTRYYDSDMELGPIPERFEELMSSIRYTYSNLKILEVGAGTGGFTVRLLQSLCPVTEDSESNSIANYEFTDVSPSFFEKAKTRLADWSHLLDYKKLDLGDDPISQGFLAESYDMIVASNVLHATPDLLQTMKNMRSLLKPNGRILFLEGVRQDTLYSNISFSALPGWWLGKEAFRQWCPYVSTDKWQELLCESGFSGLDVNIRSSEYPEFNKISIMLSTAVQASSGGTGRKVVIISPDSHTTTVDKMLLDVLMTMGIRKCAIVHPSDLEESDLGDAICICLLELHTPILDSLDEVAFFQVKHMLTTCNRMLWVTGSNDPRYQMATGLIRTIRWERDSDDLNLITLAVDTETTPAEVVQGISRILSHQFLNEGTPHGNSEYRLQNGQIQTNRVVSNTHACDTVNSQFIEPDAEPIGWNAIDRPVKLPIGQPGTLDSLHWVTDTDAAQPLKPTELEIEVRAVGMNFRDLLTVMGELPQATIGGEAAGVVTRLGSGVTKYQVGDRVAYFGDPGHVGTFRTLGRADQDLVVQVPDQFSFEQAASMPVIHTTVIYSLKTIARLAEGETILIHAAAGGVGQAAIQYAQLVGAEIFATVSTVEKKQLLMTRYGIKEDHIFSSRDLSFVAGVRNMVPDGVDVILNSLAGEALRQSWECIAPFGRFIEIGKRDIQTGGKLDMTTFLKNAMFASVDLLTVAKHRPKMVGELLQDMVQLWQDSKISEPHPTTVLSYGKLQTGLRCLQMGQTMGKIICTPQDDEVPVLPDPPSPHHLDPNASYILAGGLGGIGRSIAHWMASRGAKHLIFLTRSDQLTSSAEATLSTLSTAGCQTTIFRCDISNATQLGAIIHEIQTTHPPIRGCINCSVAWADSIFENMTHTQWQASLGPKVHGSWNLHTLLQSHDLDFFTMLSSVAGVVGNRSQANYNAGNTFEDALARHRTAQGLPGTSIDLGAVVSVGFMAENREYVRHSLKIATHHREDQMLAILDYVLDPRHQVTEQAAQLICGLSTPAAYEKRRIPPPKHLQYPMFMHLRGSTSQSGPQGEKTEDYHVQALLAASRTEDEAVSVVLNGIRKKLSSILSVAEEDIDPERSIRDNGVDSLIEMEFRTWVGKELGCSLGKGDVGDRSVRELSAKVIKGSAFVRLGK
ncbi:type I polyketide synthase [Aspergillus ibericus CBS 121593]|uniref:Iterative type I polyketide synthase n=1 Tax=Aspergillus ibericus CBS 121593 TaxID=1448316 RepID=A0A395H4I9_9EURO|nr:iterative type I polyketide synthase [Aspergillus ibericus CBS 121593]RAL02560.1 iterative type I polyketide synthase [Aspergillus ibericus CBS 121593]